MKSAEAHQLHNILQVILGAIETGNVDLARQAVCRAESCIVNCQLTCKSCEMLKAPPTSARPPKGLGGLFKRKSG